MGYYATSLCCIVLRCLHCCVQRFDLEIINIMNNDATLNAAAGAYEGLDRFEARKKLWSDMKVSSDRQLQDCLYVMHRQDERSITTLRTENLKRMD